MRWKKAWLVFVLFIGWHTFAQGANPRNEGKTCLVVTDTHNRKFEEKDLRLDVFRVSGNTVDAIGRRLCFGGIVGSTYIVKVSAAGHKPVHVVIEIDEQSRTRVVALSLGVVESRAVSVKGRVNCSSAHCLVKLIQIDGEYVYTIDATRKDKVEFESVYSGKYVIGLQREASIVCVLPITVKAWEVDAVEVDLGKCLTAGK